MNLAAIKKNPQQRRHVKQRWKKVRLICIWILGSNGEELPAQVNDMGPRRPQQWRLGGRRGGANEAATGGGGGQGEAAQCREWSGLAVSLVVLHKVVGLLSGNTVNVRYLTKTIKICQMLCSNKNFFHCHEPNQPAKVRNGSCESVFSPCSWTWLRRTCWRGTGALACKTSENAVSCGAQIRIITIIKSFDHGFRIRSEYVSWIRIQI
jgi:hypothetical protein